MKRRLRSATTATDLLTTTKDRDIALWFCPSRSRIDWSLTASISSSWLTMVTRARSFGCRWAGSPLTHRIGARRFIGSSATANGRILHYPVYARSIRTTRSRTSVILKPMPLRTGPAPGCRQNLNGNGRRQRSTSTEISSRASGFTRHRRGGAPAPTAIFNKCSATRGSGAAVLTRHIPAIAQARARLANTTASSCAINTCFVAVHAQRRAPTFAKPIGTSFRPINGGNSPGSVWRAISRERENHFCCCRRDERKLSRRSPGRTFKIAPATAVQVFLRPARRAIVPGNLRPARILHYPNRDRDSAVARRGHGKGARSASRADWSRHRRRNEDPHPARRVAQSGCLRANRHFEGTA